MMTLEQILGIDKRGSNTPRSNVVYGVEEVVGVSSEPAWKRYQQGDTSASTELLKTLQPTIDRAINNFGGADKGLLTKSRIMALEAVKSYDNSRGTALSTHVYNSLQRLIRESGERGNLTHVPENVAILRSKIKDAIREWEVEHDDTPTTEQLADKTGISIKRLDAVMNYKAITPDSLTTSPEGDQLVGATSDRVTQLYTRLIYDELDNTDKKIYEWYTGFGKGEKLSGKDIAARLKMSPAAVSKRYAGIVRKFAEGNKIVAMVTQ